MTDDRQHVLVVCAVDAEAAAVEAPFAAEDVRVGPLAGRRLTTPGAEVDVVMCGVGPAAAGAAAAYGLATATYDAVLSIGVAGAFAGGGAAIGGLVVADEIVFADLGVVTNDGFTDIATVGFGDGLERVTPPAPGVAALHARCAATAVPVVTGTILTLATFTGTDARAAELISTHHAAAEAMEGSGVATAASFAGVPAFEVRSISNPVGDRDREVWELPAALAAITAASAAIFAEPLPL